MKHITSILLTLSLASAPLVAIPASSSAPPMPRVLFEGADSRLPIWVVASAAVGNDGQPRADVIGLDNARAVKEQLATVNASGCAPFDRSDLMYALPPPRDNLDQAVEHSRTRILGKVTNKAFGIYSGSIPGQLVQIEPQEVFGDVIPQTHYYFFLPLGSFRLGETRVCKTENSYAAAPAVGSELFLFIAGRPTGTENNLLVVYGPGDVVPVARDGSLSLPRQYRADGSAAKVAAPRTRSALLDNLRKRAPREVAP